MSTAFDIQAEFVTRDPEWAVTYEERDADGATRTCRFVLFPGELCVGSLVEWDSPRAPIDSETRERILDRVFAWALSLIRAAQAILAQGGVEDRAPHPSPFRAVALTLAGSQPLPVQPGDVLERAATALLVELIERTVPL